MTIPAIRTALAGVLRRTNLHVYEWIEDSIEPPCIVVGNPEGFYDEDNALNMRMTWPVHLIVSRPDGKRATKAVDAFLGTSSVTVPAVINADDDLGGTVGWARVVRFGDFDIAQSWGDATFAGVTFFLEIGT